MNFVENQFDFQLIQFTFISFVVTTLNYNYQPFFSLCRDLPKNHEDWIELLRQQEALHETEMRKWQAVLQTAIELLKKVSVVCEKIVQLEQNGGNPKALHNEL